MSQRELGLLDSVGLDFPLPDRNRIAADRMKQGLCPNCGTATHKIERNLFGKKKIPLTTEGKSENGVCLNCTRSPKQHQQQQQQQLGTTSNNNASRPAASVPRVLEVQDRGNDDMTVVSQITLDHRLEMMDDDSDALSDFRVVPGQRRPEPSLGDPEEYAQRPESRRNRTSAAAAASAAGGGGDQQFASRAELQQQRRATYMDGHQQKYEPLHENFAQNDTTEFSTKKPASQLTASVARPNLFQQMGGGNTLSHRQTARLIRNTSGDSSLDLHHEFGPTISTTAESWQQPPALQQPPSAGKSLTKKNQRLNHF